MTTRVEENSVKEIYAENKSLPPGNYFLELGLNLWNSSKICERHQCGYMRDHAQNATNPAISLVVYNVVSLLIGPPE